MLRKLRLFATLAIFAAVAILAVSAEQAAHVNARMLKEAGLEDIRD